jgi:riboflavin kinase/FMN adenylyltransferase
MRVMHSIEELRAIPGPVVLAVGVFDGVHLGHRAVIQRALDDAHKIGGTAVVVTFEPHPIRVLRPEQTPLRLTVPEHKLLSLSDLGAAHLLVLDFTPELAASAPEDFIRELAGACRPLSEICVGYEWCFGRGRAGNLDLLRRLGADLGFQEVGVEAVRIDGEIVSSTAIRRALDAGRLEVAERLLGRPYSVRGKVVAGNRLGTQLGFPTANLDVLGAQLPPNGVYATRVQLDASAHIGVANLGIRPTLAGNHGQRHLEVHLIDFSADIYGQTLELTFCKFLRPEKKFDHLDALRAQIAVDCDQARSAF